MKNVIKVCHPLTRFVALFALTATQLAGCGSGSSGASTSIAPPNNYIATSNYISSKDIILPTFGSSYPQKGEIRTDSTTGAKIVRRSSYQELTGDYNNYVPTQSLIVYSRFSPVNTTNEFYLVHGANSTSCWVYRTSNNQVATILKFDPSISNKATSRSLGEINEIRWDYSGNHPYRLYFVGRSIDGAGMKFFRTDIDPISGTQSNPVLVHDFSNEFPVSTYPGASIMNDVEGDSSNNSRYWAWQVMNTTLGTGYLPYAIITYDMQTDTIIGILTPDDVPNYSGQTYLPRPNMVEVSPLGTRVIVHWGRCYAGKRPGDIGTVSDGPKAFLKDFSDKVNPVRIAADETHSGWAWGANGEELFVSQNNRNDYMEAVDITSNATNNCHQVSGEWWCGTQVISMTNLATDYSIGMHFGKIYDQSKRNWMMMSTSKSISATSSYWGQNQMLFIEIKAYNSVPAPKVWRIIPSYNEHYDYRSEGSAALSWDASGLWWTANWGYTDGRAEVFYVGFPSDWYQRIQQ